MIFRGKKNGFKAEAFHNCCDNKGPTLTIVKSEKEKVFGAYTDIPWSSKMGYNNGNGNTFVFSLRDDLNFVKLKCLEKSDEVYHHRDILTSIGYMESGFTIYDDCNINERSISILGYENKFELPKGIKSYSEEAYSYLAGSKKFKVLEIEVFKLE